MKILVTGSRDWTDSGKIATEIFRQLYEMKTDPGHAVLIVGGCPTGADKLALMYARETGMNVRIVEADWQTHRKAAGPVRNSAMVALEPDVCLAFIKNESRGATDCAHKAHKAGIETRIFRG